MPRMEAWLPVVGREEQYEISDQGRVRRLSHEVPVTSRNGNIFMRRLRPKLLSPQRYESGHLYVVLGQEHIRIHHLMLEAFVGPRPDGMNGLHRDDDPDNNTIPNLYWGTYSDNQHDKVANGNHHNANKTECPRGHQYSPANTRVDNQGRRHCKTCYPSAGSPP
jgi:hypothetical protein